MAQTRGTKLEIRGLDEKRANLINSRIMEAAYSSMKEMESDTEFSFGLVIFHFNLSFGLDWDELEKGMPSQGIVSKE